MDSFKCLNCGKVLAQTDGKRLVINGTQVKGASCGGRQVSILCECGKFRAWHPVNWEVARPDKAATTI